MPALILAALQIAAVWIIQRLIVGFGIGFVTYKVSSYLTDWVVGQIRWGLGQIGGATAELISTWVGSGSLVNRLVDNAKHAQNARIPNMHMLLDRFTTQYRVTLLQVLRD